MPATNTSGASLTEQVAAEIRAQMGRRSIRQSELARTLGVTEMWLSRRLRGTQTLDLDDLEKISKALGCRIIDLLPSEGNAATREKSQAPDRPRDTRPNGRAETRNVRPESRGARRPQRIGSSLPAPAMMVMSGA